MNHHFCTSRGALQFCACRRVCTMPENSETAGNNNISGPDFFGLYKSEVDELLSELSVGLNEVGRETCSTKNSCQTSENNASTGSTSLFSNGVGARLSELKKERLRSLLRQSVFTLTQEIDEMESPVVSICRIRSFLGCKESLLSLDSSTCEVDEPQHPQKKAKVISACPDLGNEDFKLDEDMRFILEHAGTRVEELMAGQASEISTALDHMEKKLEGLLNSVMTSCRTMTPAEKQQLRRQILKLPARYLDRVVEIIEHNNHSLTYTCDVVNVDLDRLDNVTLWRLYFYVATVEAASST